jgi:hypothetical protein
MIKLQLTKQAKSLSNVQAMPGLADVPLDERFGLICINPRDELYVVRTNQGIENLNRRRQLSPEILDVYGDVRISTA